MKTKKKKNKNLYFKIVALIYALLNALFLGLIYKLDILPTKFFLPLVLVIIFIGGTIIFPLLHKKIKKKIKIPVSILAIIISLGFLLGNIYLIKTLIVLGGNTNLGYNLKNYSVIVLKNSKYESLSDLENKTLGYFANDLENNQVIKELGSKVHVDFIKYDTLDELATDLLNNEVDSIVLEDGYKAMLLDNTEIKNENLVNFDTKTKTIHKFKIKVETEEIKKDIDVREESFNIYISGIDTYGEVSAVSRSDVNIIATVNPRTNEILLTTIPRDYYVQLSGTTGYKDKLTHAGIYGIDMSVKTIEDLLDIDINYYVKVNFTSLTDIVDALGGVDVYSEYSFYSTNFIYYNKGYNYVDGAKALEFVRERHAFIDGDFQRGKNQVALIEAIFKKCIDPSILVKYTSLLESVNGSFATNMSSDKITSLIKKQLDENASWTIKNNNLIGTDSNEYTYSYSANKLAVILPNEDSVNNTKALIKEVMNNEKND